MQPKIPNATFATPVQPVSKYVLSFKKEEYRYGNLLFLFAVIDFKWCLVCPEPFVRGQALSTTAAGGRKREYEMAQRSKSAAK